MRTKFSLYLTISAFVVSSVLIFAFNLPVYPRSALLFQLANNIAKGFGYILNHNIKTIFLPGTTALVLASIKLHSLLLLKIISAFNALIFFFFLAKLIELIDIKNIYKVAIFIFLFLNSVFLFISFLPRQFALAAFPLFTFLIIKFSQDEQKQFFWFITVYILLAVLSLFTYASLFYDIIFIAYLCFYEKDFCSKKYHKLISVAAAAFPFLIIAAQAYLLRLNLRKIIHPFTPSISDFKNLLGNWIFSHDLFVGNFLFLVLALIIFFLLKNSTIKIKNQTLDNILKPLFFITFTLTFVAWIFGFTYTFNQTTTFFAFTLLFLLIANRKFNLRKNSYYKIINWLFIIAIAVKIIDLGFNFSKTSTLYANLNSKYYQNIESLNFINKHFHDFYLTIMSNNPHLTSYYLKNYNLNSIYLNLPCINTPENQCTHLDSIKHKTLLFNFLHGKYILFIFKKPSPYNYSINFDTLKLLTYFPSTHFVFKNFSDGLIIYSKLLDNKLIQELQNSKIIKNDSAFFVKNIISNDTILIKTAIFNDTVNYISDFGDYLEDSLYSFPSVNTVADSITKLILLGKADYIFFINDSIQKIYADSLLPLLSTLKLINLPSGFIAYQPHSSIVRFYKLLNDSLIKPNFELCSNLNHALNNYLSKHTNFNKQILPLTTNSVSSIISGQTIGIVFRTQNGQKLIDSLRKFPELNFTNFSNAVVFFNRLLPALAKINWDTIDSLSYTIITENPQIIKNYLPPYVKTINIDSLDSSQIVSLLYKGALCITFSPKYHNLLQKLSKNYIFKLKSSASYTLLYNPKTAQIKHSLQNLLNTKLTFSNTIYTNTPQLIETLFASKYNIYPVSKNKDLLPVYRNNLLNGAIFIIQKSKDWTFYNKAIYQWFFQAYETKLALAKKFKNVPLPQKPEIKLISFSDFGVFYNNMLTNLNDLAMFLRQNLSSLKTPIYTNRTVLLKNMLPDTIVICPTPQRFLTNNYPNPRFSQQLEIITAKLFYDNISIIVFKNASKSNDVYNLILSKFVGATRIKKFKNAAVIFPVKNKPINLQAGPLVSPQQK